MTKTFKRIIATGMFFIALAALAVALVVSAGHNNASTSANPLDNFKNGALNTALDITGVKGHIDSELRARTGALASTLGVSQSVADDIVDSLAIENWQAATLPAGVQETSTSTVNVDNLNVNVTTYDDPGYVTVGAYGLSVTLKAPESAQVYTPLLEYLQYLS